MKQKLIDTVGKIEVQRAWIAAHYQMYLVLLPVYVLHSICYG
jgi:hypothetical protein